MADVKWIKITTDIFDDEKILLIESLPDSYAIITVWFKLLCLAGKQNNSGVFMMGRIPYTDKMLATIFRMKETTITMALQTFEQFGMIEIVDGVITIPNWDKHQSLDKLELAKEKTRQRVAKHREKQKLLAECNADGNVTVTECNAYRIEEDKEIEREEAKEIKGATSKRFTRFVPPTLDEVRAYCQERKNNVDPKKFYDYFTASDWHDSKGKKVQSWKQKVITWEGYHNKTTGANGIPISNASSDLDDIF